MDVMNARRKVWNVGEGIFDCGIFLRNWEYEKWAGVWGGYGFADIAMDIAMDIVNTLIEQRDI
jgi:hypothetical protein